MTRNPPDGGVGPAHPDRTTSPPTGSAPSAGPVSTTGRKPPARSTGQHWSGPNLHWPDPGPHPQRPTTPQPPTMKTRRRPQTRRATTPAPVAPAPRHDGLPSGMGHRPTCAQMFAVSYTHLRAHETDSYLVCRLL